MFDTTSGVLQWDTLSPHLFILLVDCILRQSFVDEDRFTLKPANGCRHPAVTLTALAYADDVAIASNSASGAERTLRRLQFHSDAIGLKLNAANTKVLHVGYESDDEPILTLDGTTIDVCDIYNYRGLPAHTYQSSYSPEIRRRLVFNRYTMSDVSFDGTRCIENQTFQIGRQNDSSLCTGIPPP